VKLSACISGKGGITDWHVYPDGYITFPSSLATGFWESCDAVVALVHSGTWLTSQGYNCADFANFGGTAHYGPLDWHVNFGPCPYSYYTELQLSATYNGTGYLNYALSPYETFTC
jgi:hypothetical protein